MATKHYSTSTTSRAWDLANEFINYECDRNASEEFSKRAGYKVVASGNGDWVSELGDRLEVNLANGDTINIWINQFDEQIIKDAIKIVDNARYQIEDKINESLQREVGLTMVTQQLQEVLNALFEML